MILLNRFFKATDITSIQYLLIILVRNGHIKRITDPDIQSSVLEIMGTNVSTTFIQCPADPKKTLAIKLPFLVMIIKNVRDNFIIWSRYELPIPSDIFVSTYKTC
jgi:hypothetical protein